MAADRAVQVDGAASIAHHDRGDAEAAGVERRIGHAVVVGESGEKHAGEIALAKVSGQTGRGGAVVFKECGIGVDPGAKAFAEDQLCLGQVERGVKLRAARSLDAVIGPECLLAITDLYLLEGPLSRVGAREGLMVGRVPVLCEADVLEERRDPVDDGNDVVAARDGQLPAGAEVILDVDDEEEILGSEAHKVVCFSYLQFMGNCRVGCGWR